MAVRGKAFTITGQANADTFDTAGLESTEVEKRYCERVIINVSGYAGNLIELWLDREKIFEIYDYHLQTDASSGSTNVQYATNKLNEIPVELEIPVGRKLQVSINCGGTAKNVFGTYVYHIV